jgi:hypothetical protein
VGHCTTRRKVADSKHDDVIEFFLIYLIPPAALGPGVYSSSNINEYHEQKKMLLESKARPAREP